MSPSGGTGAGTAGDPWSLEYALSHPAAVNPGDTIWLHGGTYTGTDMNTYSNHLVGTEAAPIIVRGYPGEHATVTPTLSINYGAHVWFWGFEIMNPDPNTYDPYDHSRYATVWMNGGSDIKLINLVLHEGGWGIGCWTESERCEIYGCIIFYNGWDGSNQGHGIYTQNDAPWKRYEDNIIFGQLGSGYGMHAYGSSAAFLRNMHFEGNVMFNNPGNNILVGGGCPSENIIVRNNFTYAGGGARFGYSAANVNAEITGNYFAGNWTVNNWGELTVSGNTAVNAEHVVRLNADQFGTLPTYSWDGNAYFGSGAAPFRLQTSSGDEYHDFGGWKARTGFDANSTFSTAQPPENHVFLRGNKYEPARANVIIYNWRQEDSVDVDVSSFMSPGETYEVRDAENVTGVAVASGTYDGSPLSIPMDLTEMATPCSPATTVPQHSPREFGVYVLTVSGGTEPPGIELEYAVISGAVADDSDCPATVTVDGTAVAVTSSGNTGTWVSQAVVLAGDTTVIPVTTEDGNGNSASLTVTVSY